MTTPESKSSGSKQDSDLVPTRRSLLSRLRNFDDAASWRAFFDTYWKLIYSAATKAGLSDAEAQDVVQETVLTVSRQIGQFHYDSNRGSFKGWLLNTTRWRILDQIKRRKPAFNNQPERDESRQTDLLEQIPDPAYERVEQVWETEWQQNLVDAAAQRIKRQVNPKHFQIFELYALKNWSAKKVAATMGVSLAQVHLIKHRIAGLLKKEVQRLQEKGI